MTLLDTALAHLHAGRSLLPINAQKRPHSPALLSTGHSKDGQASWKALQERRPSEAQVRTWLGHPACGLGVVTGQISNLVIIDADQGEGVERFTQWGLHPHAHVRTRSGGLHWYIEYPGWRVRTLQSQTNKNLDDIKGIDIRADGGYAVIPPSAFGEMRYVALRSHLLLDHASMLPVHVQDLLDLLRAPQETQAPKPTARARTAGRANRSAPTGQGQPGSAPGSAALGDELLQRALGRVSQSQGRNDSGFWLAIQLRDNAFSKPVAEQYLVRYAEGVPQHNLRNQRDAYTTQEALLSLAQAYKSTPRKPWNRAATAQRQPRAHPLPPLTRLMQAWDQLSEDEQYYALRCVSASQTGQALFTQITPLRLRQARQHPLDLTALLILLDSKGH